MSGPLIETQHVARLSLENVKALVPQDRSLVAIDQEELGLLKSGTFLVGVLEGVAELKTNKLNSPNKKNLTIKEVLPNGESGKLISVDLYGINADRVHQLLEDSRCLKNLWIVLQHVHIIIKKVFDYGGAYCNHAIEVKADQSLSQILVVTESGNMTDLNSNASRAADSDMMMISSTSNFSRSADVVASTSKSPGKPSQGSSSSYSPYEGIKNLTPDRKHSIFGVVRQVVKETTQTKKGTYHLMLGIVDPTCPEQDDLLVHVFINDMVLGRPLPDLPGGIKVGDIIRIKEMRTQMYGAGKEATLQGTVYSAGQIVKFSGLIDDEISPVTHSTSYHINDRDIQQVKDLRLWWTQQKEKEQEENLAKTLSQIQKEGVFHLYCQVEEVQPVIDSHFILRVSDGTLTAANHPQYDLHNATQCIESQHEQYQPPGALNVDIVVFSPKLEVESLQCLDIVKLSNIQAWSVDTIDGVPELELIMNNDPPEAAISKLPENDPKFLHIRREILKLTSGETVDESNQVPGSPPRLTDQASPNKINSQPLTPMRTYPLTPMRTYRPHHINSPGAKSNEASPARRTTPARHASRASPARRGNHASPTRLSSQAQRSEESAFPLHSDSLDPILMDFNTPVESSEEITTSTQCSGTAKVDTWLKDCPNNSLVLTGGRDASPMDQTLTGGGEDHSPMGQTLTGGGEDHSPMGQTLTGGGEDHSPMGQTLTGGGGDASPMGQTLTGGGGDHSPMGVVLRDLLDDFTASTEAGGAIAEEDVGHVAIAEEDVGLVAIAEEDVGHVAIAEEDVKHGAIAEDVKHGAIAEDVKHGAIAEDVKHGAIAEEDVGHVAIAEEDVGDEEEGLIIELECVGSFTDMNIRDLINSAETRKLYRVKGVVSCYFMCEGESPCKRCASNMVCVHDMVWGYCDWCDDTFSPGKIRNSLMRHPGRLNFDEVPCPKCDRHCHDCSNKYNQHLPSPRRFEAQKRRFEEDALPRPLSAVSCPPLVNGHVSTAPRTIYVPRPLSAGPSPPGLNDRERAAPRLLVPFLHLAIQLQDTNGETVDVALRGNGANDFFGVEPSFHWLYGDPNNEGGMRKLTLKMEVFLTQESPHYFGIIKIPGGGETDFHLSNTFTRLCDHN